MQERVQSIAWQSSRFSLNRTRRFRVRGGNKWCPRHPKEVTKEERPPTRQQEQEEDLGHDLGSIWFRYGRARSLFGGKGGVVLFCT